MDGILQAIILEWVAMPSSRGSSQPRDQTQVSLIEGRFFTIWTTREAQEYWSVAYPFSMAYLKKQEKNQINNLTLHLKQLEKEEMKNPRVSRRKKS